jgi:hypothetical protein
MRARAPGDDAAGELSREELRLIPERLQTFCEAVVRLVRDSSQLAFV